jgi:hypothetical protein
MNPERPESLYSSSAQTSEYSYARPLSWRLDTVAFGKSDRIIYQQLLPRLSLDITMPGGMSRVAATSNLDCASQMKSSIYLPFYLLIAFRLKNIPGWRAMEKSQSSFAVADSKNG